MSFKGKIYLQDHNGESVGIGQSFEVKQVGTSYAGFLEMTDGFVQFTEPWETAAEAYQAIKGGIGTIIVEEDDF